MTRRSAAGGMTLIELMVALLIGMILTLAVFGVMASFEGKRRTLNSNADLDQAGTVAMYQIDRWVRSAGTGFAQASSYAYGCVLNAAKSNTQVLPSGTLGTPFDAVNPGSTGVFRLAPLLILPEQTPITTTNYASSKPSDVLVVMSGGAGSGNAPTLFSSTAAASLLTLANTVPFNASDLVLLADKQPASSGISACLLTQAGSSVSGSATTTMALGGKWYEATVNSRSVTDYPDSAVAMNLGNPSSGVQPSFQLVGVGGNNALYTYDLLGMVDAPLRQRAQGVFEMHALYGVDTDGDGLVDLWVSPTTSPYTVSELSAGTTTAATLLKNIRAVRIGLILRTSLPEKDAVKSSATLTLFSDINSGALTYTRALTSDEQHYRYRTVEATIPLRNNFL